MLKERNHGGAVAEWSKAAFERENKRKPKGPSLPLSTWGTFKKEQNA